MYVCIHIQYNIASKTCFDQSPAANARRGDERVRVSKVYIPVSSSPPLAPEGPCYLEKAESTLPMDLRRDEERTRELWERFGQVAPPPPSTLMVVNRPQPMRRHDGSIVLCVLYAFGPEDIKASSPGNIALREELAVALAT